MKNFFKFSIISNFITLFKSKNKDVSINTNPDAITEQPTPETTYAFVLISTLSNTTIKTPERSNTNDTIIADLLMFFSYISPFKTS